MCVQESCLFLRTKQNSLGPTKNYLTLRQVENMNNTAY
jgi:hypothetical protein